tara:strand:+ start:513 stop:659 length:147 start_codon:yes stop_codon:yes gene_type:complete
MVHVLAPVVLYAARGGAKHQTSIEGRIHSGNENKRFTKNNQSTAEGKN